MARKKDPLQLADEASRAFTLQAEEATKAMQKQADEADRELRKQISPLWDTFGKSQAKNLKAVESLATGGLDAPEPYKEEDEDTRNTIKVIFGTSGEYPDGTKWERDATEEEAAKYDSWCK